MAVITRLRERENREVVARRIPGAVDADPDDRARALLTSEGIEGGTHEGSRRRLAEGQREADPDHRSRNRLRSERSPTAEKRTTRVPFFGWAQPSSKNRVSSAPPSAPAR